MRRRVRRPRKLKCRASTTRGGRCSPPCSSRRAGPARPPTLRRTSRSWTTAPGRKNPTRPTRAGCGSSQGHSPTCSRTSAALHIGVAKGCIPEIMTSTFTDYDEWVAAVQASQGEGGGAPPLWFWKKINSANSKGISVTRTVEGGRQILMLDAAAGKDAQAKRALTTTFDDTFMGRMADALNKGRSTCHPFQWHRSELRSSMRSRRVMPSSKRPCAGTLYRKR